jgi:ribonuclease HI
MSSSSVEDAVNVYADGSCVHRPSRLGGAAFRLVTINSEGNEDSVDVPLLGYRGSSNNEMELYACIEGIKEARRHPRYETLRRIVVHTDSRYVQANFDRAKWNWSQHGWHNRYGRPIFNAELWQDLLKVIKSTGFRVRFSWLKGHAGDPHNKAADKMAKASARAAVLPPHSIVTVRRKITAQSVEPGSVTLTGQKLSIRIITDQYLSLPRIFKFKYEVISKASPYFGKVDLIFSDVPLAAGHCYYVLLNNDQNNPRVRKVIRELPKAR